MTQDFRLAELIEQEGRGFSPSSRIIYKQRDTGCVILVNKWDLLPESELERDERAFKVMKMAFRNVLLLVDIRKEYVHN